MGEAYTYKTLEFTTLTCKDGTKVLAFKDRIGDFESLVNRYDQNLIGYDELYAGMARIIGRFA